MDYIALYRRWRPQDFDALVGQDHIRTALTNALDTGKIAHAYLFTGPRGTGKTSTARILAKALNCEKGPSAHPCNQCENCLRATEGSSMDIFEIDAASNRGIDEIRQLREKVAFAPVNGRYKIYIIDEVHMMTNDAFNALLKTLEEPPAHVVFILATTEPHKIPATIHSRCQRFDFHRVTVEEIAAHLAKVARESEIEADEDALRLIAIQADGGMRDALSLLDQCAVMDTKVTVEAVRSVLGIVGREGLRALTGAIGEENLPQALLTMNDLIAQGKDVRQILTELSEYLRALLLYQAAPHYGDIYLTDTKEALQKLAPLFTEARIVAAQQRLHEAMEDLRWAVRGKITAELCIFDLCKLEGSSLQALQARVEKLEKMLAGKDFREEVTLVAAPVTPGHSVPEPTKRVKQAAETTIPTRVVQPEQPAADVVIAKAPHAVGAASHEEVRPEKVKTESTGAGGEMIPEGEELWSKALARIKADKKMSLHACASCGSVEGFDGRNLTVGFKVAYSCERMKRHDYKQMIEEVMLELSREAVCLHCVVEEAKPAKKAAKKEQELDPTVKKALEIFGGTLEKL